MRVTQSERITRPAQPLVPVDDGRIDSGRWRQWLYVIGATGVCVVASTTASFAAPGVDHYGPMPAWRTILLYGAFAVAIMSGLFTAILFGLEVWSILSYRIFLGKYRAVELAARTATNNQEVHEVVSEWDLDTTNPRDLIVAVVAMQHAINSNSRAPWAHRVLTDNGLWFDRRKLAEVSDGQARDLPRLLEAMGYISGRDERQAGYWTITPLPRDYSHVDDIAEAYGCNPDDVRRYVAMGAAVDRLRKGIGKVM